MKYTVIHEAQNHLTLNRELLDTLVINIKIAGVYTNSVSMAGCPFVNNVKQTLKFEIQTDLGIQISLDVRVLTTYHGAHDPSAARILNFYVTSPEDFITLRRIEFIKV
ncbi:hypothetical protein DPMN_033920 [Dreissena polymorpha]|uniref:Uncharacterized protein n=1 Tax=Dreissena polymorpha TaxID=45954 RepID=A0A9D4M5S4_DREPO|nr:hypothetical protein DPMN_033920 [Dreissena polymorpha]